MPSRSSLRLGFANETTAAAAAEVLQARRAISRCHYAHSASTGRDYISPRYSGQLLEIFSALLFKRSACEARLMPLMTRESIPHVDYIISRVTS